MAFATIRRALEEAAKRGELLPHQLSAASALDEILTTEQKAAFTEAWRAVGSPAAPARLRPSSPFSLRVTPHITYGELTLGQEARRFVRQYQCDTAVELCEFVEKARAAFGGKPAIITSAYRPPAINAAVGGASRSEHLYDAPGVGAIDFYLDGVSTYALQDWADAEWPYSLGYGADRGFIHIGKREGAPRLRWDY